MTKESNVIRLSNYVIEILEDFRQEQIKLRTQSLNKENDKIAKACYENDILRFKNMKLSELVTEYITTQEIFKKHH